MSPPYDGIVLGAGAAGLFCAFHAARRGRRVLVLEPNAEPGRKILISGGGRCNFTNLDIRPDRFLSANPHFAKSALARYTSADFRALVQHHGIAWHEKTLGQLFCDGSARQILDMLLAECRESGVVIRTGTLVRSVSRDGDMFQLATPYGAQLARSLVIATGGPSIPKLGATGFAYEIAAQFGLRVVTPRPALVPLTFSAADLDRWRPLAGVAASAEVSAAQGPVFPERILFTHRGLSGPAVLQASSYWKPGEAVSINLTPGFDLSASLLSQKQAGDRTRLRAALSPALPERLAAAWVADNPVFDRPLHQVPDAALRSLAEQLSPWRVVPAGTEGWEKAEVAGGGVDTRDLSSQTMAARSVPGLYFIGECVDVTGWLGGYNFQWAWSSAYAAAQAV